MRKVAFLCLVIAAVLAFTGIASAQNGTINPLSAARRSIWSSPVEKTVPSAIRSGEFSLLQNGSINPL